MTRNEPDMEGAVAEAAAEGETVDAAASEVLPPLQGEEQTAAALEASDAAASESAKANDEDVSRLQAELEAERARYAELMDRYQRSAAEFQNARRRLDKQAAESIERAGEATIRRLLPILDDLELAFRNIPDSLAEDQTAWIGGFRQIQKKLSDLLKEQGVTPIPVDGPFDPTRHEAVTSEPADGLESGQIIATLRTGYESNGRVLRPALVRVAA
jgi:molecular chaperone GrpE